MPSVVSSVKWDDGGHGRGQVCQGDAGSSLASPSSWCDKMSNRSTGQERLQRAVGQQVGRVKGEGPMEGRSPVSAVWPEQTGHPPWALVSASVLVDHMCSPLLTPVTRFPTQDLDLSLNS